MKKTIIIFGCGYLGNEIVQQAQENFNLITTTKSGGSGHLKCDLSSPHDVSQIANINRSPSAIIHCASSGRGGLSAYQEVFIKGCSNLISLFPKIPILFTSSTSVYHQTNGEIVTETSSTTPIRETSSALLEAEKIISNAGGIITRLAGLYGPNRSVILKRFLEGSATIEDSGQRHLNQIHVQDAASAILHLINLDSVGTFNVSDNTPLSQIDCYRQLADRTKLPLPPSGPKNTSRKRAWTNKKVSNQKLRKTGWTPQYPDFISSLDNLMGLA